MEPSQFKNGLDRHDKDRNSNQRNLNGSKPNPTPFLLKSTERREIRVSGYQIGIGHKHPVRESTPRSRSQFLLVLLVSRTPTNGVKSFGGLPMFGKG